MNLTAIASWVGLASGLGSLAVAWRATVHARRSADAADRSADAAHESAEALGWFVQNTSTLPVREVSVEFYLRTPEGTLGPRPRWHAQPLRVLPPSFESKFFPASEDMMNTLGRPDDWAAGVAFTDSVGRHWRRGPDGGVLDEV